MFSLINVGCYHLCQLCAISPSFVNALPTIILPTFIYCSVKNAFVFVLLIVILYVMTS